MNMPNDNNYNDRIGLVVWGCKGGKRVFCSRGVDVRSTEISNTIKDIRSYVRFNVSFKTTYAVEFTDNYKVFTIYRSCNDSGTGGYVAITVYVPHDLKVRNMRQALTARMNEYFREFVHPAFGTYIPDQYDSIDQYKDFLMSLDVAADRKLFQYKASEQDDRAKVYVYKSDEELDGYFDNPYRPEFFGCQEVMFMREEFSQREEKDFSFNFEPTRITKVSEPEMLPHLKLAGDNRVRSLKINGEDCGTKEEWPVNGTDRVEIVLKQDRCEDLKLSGTISELKRNRQLVETAKSITIGSNIRFKYKAYPVMFKLNEGKVADGMLCIRAGKYDEQGVDITDSTALIPGDKLDQKWDVFLKICKDEIRLDGFTPSGYINNGECKRVECNKHEFRVVFDKKVEGFFYITLQKSKKDLQIPIPKDSGTSVLVYLPKEEDLKFDKQDESVDLMYVSEKKILTITPKITEYELWIPKDVKDHIDSWDFIMKDGSSRKKGSSLWGGTSYSIKLDQKETVRDGKLRINGNDREFKVKEDKIYPQIVLLKVDGLKVDGRGVNIEFKIDGKELSTTQNRICSYRKNCEFECLTKGYTYNQKNYNGVFIVELKNDEVGDSRSSDKPITTDKDTSNNPKLIIKDCKGFQFYSKKQLKDITINKDEWPGNLTSDSLEIKDKNNNLLCKVFRDQRDYSEQDREMNLKNDFKVEYLSGKILVTRLPILTINRCKGLAFTNPENSVRNIETESTQPKFLPSKWIIIRKKNSQKPLCKVFRDQRDYSEQDREMNWKNGFKVEYFSGEIVVTRQKKGFAEGILDGISGKAVILAFGALMVLAMVGIGGYFAWNYFMKPKDQTLVNIHVELAENNFGDKIAEIKVSPENECVKIVDDTIKICRIGDNMDWLSWEDLEITATLISGVEAEDAKLTNDIVEAIKKAKKKPADEFMMPELKKLEIKSPIEEEFDKAKDEFDALVKVYKMWEKDTLRKTFATEVMTKASECCDSDMAMMKDFLKEFERDSTLQVYKDVKKKLDDARDAAAADAEIQKLIQDAMKQMQKMQSINFTRQQLVNIENWWKQHPNKAEIKRVYDFDKAIDLYGKFFNANKKTQIDELAESKNIVLLGQDQQKVIKLGYCKNTETFNVLIAITRKPKFGKDVLEKINTLQ